MIASGTLLQNRYLVEEQIGQGGMGAVFVATDQRFGSRVALKETFFSDPNLRKAFEREAKLLNRLRHHALPRVSDHFTEDEGQFLVMEYIAGADLSEMLKSRGGEAFPLREALAWADQLLDALDYLHTQEPPVIHRDIKPQNLKLTARNQIVLLDFGLAKGAPLQTRVTATGSVLGYSLNYAPLEQMQGTGTDPRSDLYSLGATLYHLLTGTTPPDALTRATAVLNGDEDPLRPASEINAQVTPGVAAALMRAMSQSAAKRFGSATEMREALRQAASEAHAETDAATSAFAHASAAATIISEQETQLLDGPAAGARLTEARLSKGTQVNNAPDAPTLTDIAAATRAAAPAPTKAPVTDSIITSVRAPQPDVTQRPASRRVIGVMVGVAVLALIAVAAYTRRAASPATIEQAPTQTAAPSPSPSQNATVESQPTAEAAPTAASALTPAAAIAPTAPKRANATTPPRNAGNEGKGAGSGRMVVVAPHPPQTPEGVEDAQAEFAPNRPLTKEELQAVMQRVTRERRRAMQERRRALEFERRRRRAAPPPPNSP